MDPDAKIQVATLGTKLFFKTGESTAIDEWTVPTDEQLEPSTGTPAMTRVYGLATTPDFGGEPNTIDSTTLDNTEYETNVLGLQPSNVLSYEFNMMALIQENAGKHNLTLLKDLVDNKTKARWLLRKASGVKLYYDAITKMQFNADEQSAIEKFTIFHSLKSKIKVNVPAIS